MTDARVDVIEGPDAGRSIDLPLGARVVVGRGADVDLRLADPQVSRRHCALEHGLGGVRVVDLESRTGTVVDQGGRRAGAPGLVLERARVEVGATVLSLVRSTRGGPPPPSVAGVRLLRVLGEGGSGTVWEGTREDDGAEVAVKVLLPEADAVARARFEREADLAARLVHPGIARLFGLRHAADGRPCLVRELVRGRSLLERIELDGRLPWPEVVGLGAALAAALAHAHAHGVIHRDVKPGNVVLEAPRGTPRLIDFDLARRLGTDERTRATVARLTATGEGLGSLAYVAPEQLSSARDADARADVYGLGLTLYHAASGVTPFTDVDPEDFLDALTTRGPRPLVALVPDLPPALSAAIARAHAVRPADRHPSAADLARDLAAVPLPC